MHSILRSAIHSPCANYVLQKLITTLGSDCQLPTCKSRNWSALLESTSTLPQVEAQSPRVMTFSELGGCQPIDKSKRKEHRVLAAPGEGVTAPQASPTLGSTHSLTYLLIHSLTDKGHPVLSPKPLSVLRCRCPYLERTAWLHVFGHWNGSKTLAK